MLGNENGSVYLDISWDKFKSDGVRVIVKGYYIGQYENTNIFHVESIKLDKTNPYMKDKYYCESDGICYGSYADAEWDVTECINAYNVYLYPKKNRCEYHHPSIYILNGGKCKCINNKCTALKPINYIEVVKDYCKKEGLKDCENCNFKCYRKEFN